MFKLSSVCVEGDLVRIVDKNAFSGINTQQQFLFAEEIVKRGLGVIRTHKRGSSFLPRSSMLEEITCISYRLSMGKRI